MTKITAALLSVFTGIFFLSSCSKGPEEIRNSDKEILSFGLKTAAGVIIDPSALVITLSGDSINIIVPLGTDITQLKPEISIKGASVSPASGELQNFTAPVNYRVTAADGSSRQYVVAVETAAMSNYLYIGSGNNNFYALDAVTGEQKWKYSSTSSFAYSSPTYQDGVVYVGGIDSYVYAFNAITGDVIWKFKAGDTGIESDAVIAGNTVYVGSNDDNLYALDAATGNLKWSFATGANVSASPSIVNGVVYFGSSDNNLYALDAASGSLKWSFTTGAMINQSGPSVVNGVIYVGSRDQYLYAIDAATGQEKWKYLTPVSLEASSPTVVNGVVYIGGWYDVPGFGVKGGVYAIDVATGNLIWEGLPNSGFSSSPFVANSLLYISCDDGYFYALHTSTGIEAWKKYILPNGASAAVANGSVFVGGGGTQFIYAFDAATGAEKWKFPTPGGLMTSSPLIVGAAGDAHYSGDSGSQF